MLTETPKPVRLTIRCSSLDRAAVCPASIQPTEFVRVDPDREVSNAGTAAHAWIADFIRGSDTDIESLAALHRVESVDDLEPLIRFGRQAVGVLRRDFGDSIEVEQTIRMFADGITTKGHPDWTAYGSDPAMPTRDVVRVADFKSGYKEPRAWNQILGYLRVIAESTPQADMFVGYLVWLRDRSIEKRTFTREQLIAWWDRLVESWREEPDRFSPGDHCQYCHRHMECPGRRAMVQGAIETIGELNSIPWNDLTRHELGPTVATFYQKATAAKKAIESFLEALKHDIGMHGPLPLGHGRELYLADKARRTIDPEAAWPVLAARLDDAEIAGCVRLSITKVEAAIGAKAGHGNGAAAKRELNTALDEAGAISMETSLQLAERDATEQSKELCNDNH